MRTIYCPYTNADIPESAASPEHIIPLSLGGLTGFEIAVCSYYNRTVGSKLDGKLANEFLWALLRTKYDARGHSGKEPWATAKVSSYGENHQRAQVRFHHSKGVRVWDVRDRKSVSGKGSVAINFSLNLDLPTRFVVKVALAAGHYVYGDLFRNHVEHQQLREVMNIDPAQIDHGKSAAELGIDHLTLRVDNCLLEVPSDPDDQILLVRMFCTSVKGSAVILMPGHDCFGVAVSLLGQYLGMVNVPAYTQSFPNEGGYSWGHVITIVNRNLRRTSWANALQHWVEAIAPTN